MRFYVFLSFRCMFYVVFVLLFLDFDGKTEKIFQSVVSVT